MRDFKGMSKETTAVFYNLGVISLC